MCTRAGAFTLQMFVACQGLPAVVILLADAANGRELVLLAVDAIKAVLDRRGRSPRNDLCRTLVDLDILQLLVDAMHEIAPHHKGHADKCAEIFLLFSCADPVVKARMATGRAGGRVLHGLMRVLSSPENFESALTLKVLRCVKHLCMGEAAHMDELQKARAVPHLVALLRVKQGGGRLEAEMRNQCVNALYLLCQINRSRQEAAAVDGALPILQSIIEADSPLKEFADRLRHCEGVEGGARQLKKQAAVEFYLDLGDAVLAGEGMDALLVWLHRRRTSAASWSPPTASPSSRPSSTRPPPRPSPTCSSPHDRPHVDARQQGARPDPAGAGLLAVRALAGGPPRAPLGHRAADAVGDPHLDLREARQPEAARREAPVEARAGEHQGARPRRHPARDRAQPVLELPDPRHPVSGRVVRSDYAARGSTRGSIAPPPATPLASRRVPGHRFASSLVDRDASARPSRIPLDADVLAHADVQRALARRGRPADARAVHRPTS